MNIEELKQKYLKFIERMNSHGIPVPLVRDPKVGTSSVSLTLVFISFNVWLVSIVGKAAGYLGGMNTESAFNMFVAASALYFGRNLRLGKDSKELDIKDKE